jgi:hypothetical protein
MSGYGYTNYAYSFDASYGSSSTGNDTARQYGSKGNDQYWANAFQARMSGTGFCNLATGFEKYQARGSGGIDRACVDNLALAAAPTSSVWDEYSTLPAVKNETRGFDDVTISAVATNEDDVNLNALDKLFGEFNVPG